MPHPTQARLPFPGKPKAAHAAVKRETLDTLNRASAELVLQKPEMYGAGMVEWATRVLAKTELPTDAQRQSRERAPVINSSSPVRRSPVQ